MSVERQRAPSPLWHLATFLTMIVLAALVMHRWFAPDRLPAGDAPGYMTTVAYVRKALLQHGRVPSWRPRWFAGSTQFTSTFNEHLAFPLSASLGPVLGTQLMFALGKIAAALAMYTLFVRFFAAPLVGMIAGYAYAFGAAANCESAIGGHLDVAVAGAILPLVLVASIETARRPSWRWSAGLGILLACLLGAHYMQAVIGVLIPLVVLVLRPWRVAGSEPEPDDCLRRRTSALGAALVVFAVLGGSSLVWTAADGPNHALLSVADVEAGQRVFSEQSPLMYVNRSGWLGEWLERHHPPGLLLDADDPDFNARRYLGIVALVVVGVGGVLVRRRYSLRRWYQTFGLIFLAQYWLAIGPRTLLWQLGRTLHWSDDIDSLLGVIAMMGAGGCLMWAGLTRARGPRTDGRPTIELPLTVMLLLFMSVQSLFGFGERIVPLLRHTRSPGHFFDLAPFSFFGMFGVGLVGIAERTRAKRWLLPAVGLLVALDFWPSNRVYARGVSSRPIRELAETVANLPAEDGTLRLGMYPSDTQSDWIYPTFAAIDSDVGLAWGWLDWQAGKQWPEYMRTATLPLDPRTASQEESRREPIADELARVGRIRYFVEEVDPSARLHMPAPWQLRWSNDDFAIWERPDVLPVAYAVRSYVVATGAADVPAMAAWAATRNLVAVNAPSTEDVPRETLERASLVLRAPPGPATAEPSGSTVLDVTYRRLTPERIVLQTDAGTTPAMVFVSEAHHPWWRATTDGHAAPVLRAQDAFMAIPVGPGSHAIDLRFQPPGFVRAVDVLSLVAWVGLPLVLVAGVARQLVWKIERVRS